MKKPGVPLLVRVLALAVFLVIPFRVLGTGFLPPDDALRHAAKAVSGRSWSEVLVLRDYQGLAYAEIAAALEIPRGTVMSRLHRARRQLQELVRQRQRRTGEV